VIALWSRNRARAEELASKLHLDGVTVYDNWQDLIERAEIDVIGVATPEFLRREPVEMALERGCHILLEKPISIRLADAQEIVRRAEGAGTITATGFVWRYAPGAQVAWREVQAGKIGRILDIRMELRFRAEPQQIIGIKPYIVDVSTGLLGGAGSHEFDRARTLTGCEFSQLVARVAPCHRSEEPEVAVPCGVYMLLAELEDGVLGQFRFTLTAGQFHWGLVLHGEEGTLDITHTSVVRQCAGESEPVSLNIPASDSVSEGVTLMQHVWNRLITDFVTAVRRGDVAHRSVPRLSTLVDGLRAQEVIVATQLSEAERRWVDIQQEFRTDIHIK
jgi:predicted dehydrogenase